MGTLYDFSYCPVLETDRLRLRPITYADADALVEIFGNPEVLRFMSEDPPCHNRDEAIRLIDWLNGWTEKRVALRWGITQRENDRVIGTCGFYFFSEEHRRCDIGYDLVPAYWGRGYMTEAIHAVARWCFEALGLHRIQADCDARNIASERVMQKVGFTLEGIWRERDFEHETFVSIKQYGLLRREYLPETPPGL